MTAHAKSVLSTLSVKKEIYNKCCNHEYSNPLIQSHVCIGYRPCPRCSSCRKTCTCGSRHRQRGAREVFRYAWAGLSTGWTSRLHSIYIDCQCCYSVCKPDIDLVLDVHPVERPAQAYRNTSRAPLCRCLDPHVQVFLQDEHLGQGRYPILKGIIIIFPLKLSGDPSLESACRNGSNEGSQQRFSLRIK